MPATPPALFTELAQRGFTLRAAAGTVSVIPASQLTAGDRQAIRECRAELLAFLSPGEAWNSQVALRLIRDADRLVERLGVSGRHPEIAEAAAMVTSAHATRDMEALRFAVAEFTALVRKLAAERHSAIGKGHSA